MTLDRFMRPALGFGMAVLIDGLLVQAVNSRLLAPMPTPSADNLAHALVVLAVGAAVAGAICQLLAGKSSLTPFAVAAAVLAAGLAWLHGAPEELKMIVLAVTFACASATLLAAVGAERLRQHL